MSGRVVRLGIAAMMAISGSVRTPAASAAEARAGALTSVELGYLGCVASYPSRTVSCYVATQGRTGPTNLVVMSGPAFLEGVTAGAVTESTLPRDALRRRPDIEPFAVQLQADIPGIGAVDLLASSPGTAGLVTNAGCNIEPLHYVLTPSSLDLAPFGNDVRTRGTVNGEISQSLNICDQTILGPAAGLWVLDTI